MRLAAFAPRATAARAFSTPFVISSHAPFHRVDPFVGFDAVHNITPWLLPGDQCQDLMEVGDVIESLPANDTIPVKNLFGTTYSIQNVPLLQWF
jgi:hypothetical protein